MPDKTLKSLLIALAAMNIADYLFTLRAIYILGVPEANPFMDAALGTPLFFIIKVVLVTAGIWLIWRLRHRWMHRTVIAGLLGFAVLAYGGVTLWHIYGQFFI